MNINTTMKNQSGGINIKHKKNFSTSGKTPAGNPRVSTKTIPPLGFLTTNNVQKQTIPQGHGNLYTRREVEELLEKSDGNTSSQEIEIEKENQLRNRQKRLNNIAVENLVKKSNRLLVSIRSHAFPFDMFPDIITVEEGRITIVSRHFSSSVTHSVDIKDISNMFINRSMFFLQLVIISNTFEDNEVRMRNLRSKEAIFVRRIIEGLRLFVNKKIETAGYTKGELIAKLEELSTTEEVT